MAWPNQVDFTAAIQNPQLCFDDPDLRASQVNLGRIGLPVMYPGRFACVYQVSHGGVDYAVRCFTTEVADQGERYQRLSDYLNHTAFPGSFVNFQYLDRGIKVRNAWYPAVKMDWVEGLRLEKYINENLGEPEKLKVLSLRWRAERTALNSLGIAHNDLQHGNCLVQGDSRIRLVDYDPIFLPAFGGQPSPELGHKNYQHPQRTSQDFDANSDNFPALVIYLSIRALSADSSMWQRFNTEDNLIFRKEDFEYPERSECFRALKVIPDSTVLSLASYLEEYCSLPVGQVPDLGVILAAANAGESAAPRSARTQLLPTTPSQSMARPPSPSAARQIAAPASTSTPPPPAATGVPESGAQKQSGQTAHPAFVGARRPGRTTTPSSVSRPAVPAEQQPKPAASPAALEPTIKPTEVASVPSEPAPTGVEAVVLPSDMAASSADVASALALAASALQAAAAAAAPDTAGNGATTGPVQVIVVVVNGRSDPSES